MHLDLWPAPMRAGLCGGSRLPIRGGVASTPEFGGRPEAKQRPLPFCVCETGALGEAPSPGGVRTDVVATSKDIVGLKLILRPRTLRAAELAKVSARATLLDRCGSAASATVDTGSLQQDLWLEAVRPRAAPPSLSLKAVKC